MSTSATNLDLIRRIRTGDENAWRECIAEYSGRLHAFIGSRLGNRTSAEDLVQETFLGFLTSLPNYDERTPLESFLFAIAAHKLTDALRRHGRRPTISLQASSPDGQAENLPGRMRMASSLARSREQRDQQGTVISACLRTLIEQWMSRGEFSRLKCAELLFVQGLTNQETSQQLCLSEQDVANHKQFILAKLKAVAARDMPLRDF